ncbi:hypothetical protein [Deinococcus frigens]|uniref:hypothetical protein n=1 Tax=Deinococcus frigens TaxID=249403 RepID=UPI000AF9EE51|nr:hypothetical protein [Deinococcus frigens]
MSAVTMARALEIMGQQGGRWWTTGQMAAALGCPPEGGHRVLQQARAAGPVRQRGDGQFQRFDVRACLLAHLRANPAMHYTPGCLSWELPDLALSADEVAAHLVALMGSGELELWACLPTELGGYYEIRQSGNGQAVSE